MKRFFLSVLLFTLFTLFLTAQSTVSSSVSSIKTKIGTQNSDSATIIINWEIPRKNDIVAYLVYRDTKQIVKNSISTLKPIITLTGKYSTYTDTVTDLSKEYYYTVLAKTRDDIVFDVIIPTVNTTVNPIVFVSNKKKETIEPLANINEKRENERELIPLPFLNSEKKSTPSTVKFTDESLAISKNLSQKQKKTKTFNIELLKEDETPTSGDQYLLSTIANDSFIQQKWDIAEKEIQEFLKINRSKETISRAYFYLGQIYHYKGNNKKAIESFMYAQDDYPVQARKWLEIALTDYQIPTNE